MSFALSQHTSDLIRSERWKIRWCSGFSSSRISGVEDTYIKQCALFWVAKQLLIKWEKMMPDFGNLQNFKCFLSLSI